MLSLPSFILCCAAAASSARATSLLLSFDSSGSYKLSFDGNPWAISDARSGGIGLRSNGGALTAGVGGGLALDAAPAPIAGDSPLGPFTGTELSFNGGLVIARAKHVALASGAAAILCELNFPRGLNASRGGNLANDLAAGWPVFAPPAADAPPRGFLTWAGGMLPPRVGQWNATPGPLYGILGGPVIVFNASRATVVTSAAANFLVGGTCGGAAAPQWAGAGAFGAGLFASLDAVPVGAVHTTLLVAGGGVRATMRAWGDALLVLGGKARTALGRDLGTSHVSYWTDNVREAGARPLRGPVARCIAACLHTLCPTHPTHPFLRREHTIFISPKWARTLKPPSLTCWQRLTQRTCPTPPCNLTAGGTCRTTM